MKYIKKTEVPSFFLDDTRDLDVWTNYNASKKRRLKSYILESEQNGLCGYCESKVENATSHLEHIKPKSLNLEELTFKYKNILVSCNGKCHTNTNVPESCGHKKDNEYNETLFLNPVEIQDISDYFKYTNNGNIQSSDKDVEKSDYMIRILDLEPNNNSLQEARKKSLEEFQKVVSKYASKSDKPMKEIAKGLLDSEKLAFISFLRFRYRHVL